MVKLQTYSGLSDVVGWSSMDSEGRRSVGAGGAEDWAGPAEGDDDDPDEADPDDPEPLAAAALS
jgi:hypothetical protein